MFQKLFFSFWNANKILKSYLDETIVLAKINSQSNLLETKTILKNVSIAFAILLYNLVHYLYLYTTPLNNYWRLIHYDITLFFGCSQEWNIFNLGANLQVTYSIWRMYFKMFNNKKMATPVVLFQQILTNKKIKTFLKQKLCFRNRDIKVKTFIVKIMKIYTFLFSYAIPLFGMLFIKKSYFIFFLLF